MKFRPCIDLHNGIVKQIVGSTLSEDSSNEPTENFVSNNPVEHYSRLYREDGLTGGHIIMLGPNNEISATKALEAYPMGFQIGGGINIENAVQYIKLGASHVVVTSYVFQDGIIQFDRLSSIVQLIGKDRLVLDLSCRRRPDEPKGLYYVVTNKWTKFTDFAITPENLALLSESCSEFLVHAVDVEGKQAGIEEDLVVFLGKHSPIPVTYAGGVRSLEDLELVKRLGDNKVDCTVGSALDIFGGSLPYKEVVAWHNLQQQAQSPPPPVSNTRTENAENEVTTSSTPPTTEATLPPALPV